MDPLKINDIDCVDLLHIDYLADLSEKANQARHFTDTSQLLRLVSAPRRSGAMPTGAGWSCCGRGGKSRTYVYQHFKQARRKDCSRHGAVLQSQFTPCAGRRKESEQELQFGEISL
jgi:hypothetical protein